MLSPRFAELFGAAQREPEGELRRLDMDLAASIQRVTEEVVLRLARALAAETGARNLCLAGGVALNCVANGKLLRDGCFEWLWIQPAAGDAGGAVGAALAAWHMELGAPRTPAQDPDGMAGSYLGPGFSDAEVAHRLRMTGARFTQLPEPDLLDRTAQALAQGMAVGWFQGRMEFGPRALGARSILADPRDPRTQRTLNMKVKFRESFRPFAPAVLREAAADWFDLPVESPYMLLVAELAASRRIPAPARCNDWVGLDRLKLPRSEIPAVTHVDGSARVQTVDRRTNPKFHALIGRFRDLTGCPVLVNTSFNVRGEPIVCTPEDAYRCFMGTAIEALAIGNCLLTKETQPPQLRNAYASAIPAD